MNIPVANVAMQTVLAHEEGYFEEWGHTMPSEMPGVGWSSGEHQICKEYNGIQLYTWSIWAGYNYTRNHALSHHRLKEFDDHGNPAPSSTFQVCQLPSSVLGAPTGARGHARELGTGGTTVSRWSGSWVDKTKMFDQQPIVPTVLPPSTSQSKWLHRLNLTMIINIIDKQISHVKIVGWVGPTKMTKSFEIIFENKCTYL